MLNLMTSSAERRCSGRRFGGFEALQSRRDGGHYTCRLTLAILLFALVGGCNVAGVIASKTIGERVPAVYTPVKADSLLVIAETFRTSSSVAVDTDQLARFVTDEISRYQLAPTIDPVKVMDFRGSNPTAFRKMKISEIGKHFGAKQVLYINVIDSGIEAGGMDTMLRGQAAAKVKIVDVATADSRWPADAAEGFPVSASTPVQEARNGVTESTVRLQLQQSLATQIGRLFREYQRDE